MEFDVLMQILQTCDECSRNNHDECSPECPLFEDRCQFLNENSVRIENFEMEILSTNARRPDHVR